MKIKLKYVLFFGIALIYGLFVNNIYRKNPTKNIIISDIGSNVVFVPIMFSAFFFLRIKYFNSNLLTLTYILIMLIIVEIFSYFFSFLGQFDVKDILGLMFGALLTYFIYGNEFK